MSDEDIDRLVADRSLAREDFRDEAVVSLWGKAAESYADSRLAGLSSDGAYQSIYRAALQAAIAALAAHGLRVKSTANHYKTFYALQKLTEVLEPHGTMFNEMRAVRNESVYEATHTGPDMADHLAAARASIPASLAAVRAVIIAARPGLAARLPHIR
jgi:hypothetical protein